MASTRSSVRFRSGPQMEYSGNDFYCDIALKDTSVLKKEFESENIIAYHHTRPHYPVHIVVVPKRHIPSFIDFQPEDQSIISELLTIVRQLADKIVREHGAARILTNLGEYQDSKHLHFHVAHGKPKN